MYARKCGTCVFAAVDEEWNELVCTNSESDCAQDWVSEDNACERWEEKPEA